jgi:hypothetical protein
MTTLTIKVNERNKAGKAFLELVDFFNSNEKKVEEVVDEEEKSPYNKSFVKKIQESRKSKGVVIKTEDLWK